MSTKQEKATAPIRTMQPHPDMDKLLDSPDFDPTQWVWERKFAGRYAKDYRSFVQKFNRQVTSAPTLC